MKTIKLAESIDFQIISVEGTLQNIYRFITPYLEVVQLNNSLTSEENMDSSPKYIVDENGHRLSVILPIDEWQESNQFNKQTNLHPDLERVIVSAEQIQTRIHALAEQIEKDYKGIQRLYIIGILKGAFIFTADLTRALNIPHVVDFMALSSYGKTTTSGAVRILMDLREPIEGQHVLIVEDILDTGHTLSYLYRNLQDRNPASIKTCVLTVKKRSDLPTDVPIDYLGFEIPDVWVVGYGLDFADKHRTLPYIAEIKKTA